MIKREIETRIKPLVDILNKVPFIKTSASCKGHYDQEDYRKYNANIIFDVYQEDRANLEKLMKSVYSKTTPNWTLGSVEFYHRHYMIPKYKEIFREWQIVIEPFDISQPVERKREITDKLIRLTISGVKDYLKNSKK